MNNRKLKFTPAWVARVKPEAAPVDWRDTHLPGLILRVEPSGVKTYVVRYTLNGKDGRFTLGRADAMKLKAARGAARTNLELVAKGVDPQLAKERRRAGQTVEAAVATWLEDEKLGPGAKWKGGLEGGSARSFLPHVNSLVRDLGAKRLPELSAKDVERFVAAPEAAATRNRRLTALRGFFRWAVRKELVESDPSAGLGKERETERSRTLTDPELRALILGFDSTRYGRAVRLLALSGLRRDEVLGAEWGWFDAKAKTLTIPPEAEKTGRSRGEPRHVALSSQAVELLAEQRKAWFAEGKPSSKDEKEFVFATATGERPHPDALKPILYGLRGRRSNGQKASEHKLAKPRPAQLAADATIHDVRRTVADALLNRLGAAPWVVDHVVLGHVRPKLLRTYMPTLPLDEARTALTAWAAELARIVGDQPALKADAQ